LRDNGENQLFSAKNCLKGITGRLQTVRIRLPGRAVQYRTSEVRIRLPGRAVQYRTSEVRIRLPGRAVQNPGAGLQDRGDNVFMPCKIV
jgi:hypothetical protein